MADFDAELSAALPALLARARRWTKIDPEDLVQDTVIRALRNRDDFRPGTSMLAWLTTICRNVMISRGRRHGFRVLEFTQADEVKRVQPPNQEHRLELRDTLARISRLAPQFREVIMMAAMGESLENMAAVQGVGIGTIKSRVSRARDRVEAA